MPRDAAGPHRLEHVRRGDRVLLEIAPRMLQPVAHVGVGLQVEDPVATLERALQQATVEHIALDQLRARPRKRRATNSRRPVRKSSTITTSTLRAACGRCSDEPVLPMIPRARHRQSRCSGRACILEGEARRQRVAAEHLHGLERELGEVLAEVVELCKRSWVIVMMWQPSWSAWTTLSTSRGDAQINSERGAATMMSTARA